MSWLADRLIRIKESAGRGAFKSTGSAFVHNVEKRAVR
jgi:hypothetical protein